MSEDRQQEIVWLLEEIKVLLMQVIHKLPEKSYSVSSNSDLKYTVSTKLTCAGCGFEIKPGIDHFCPSVGKTS